MDSQEPITYFLKTIQVIMKWFSQIEVQIRYTKTEPYIRTLKAGSLSTEAFVNF